MSDTYTMSKEEKIAFVESCCNNMRDSIVGLIEQGRIPANWSGHELRQYIEDTARDSINWSRAPWGGTMRGSHTSITQTIQRAPGAAT